MSVVAMRIQNNPPLPQPESTNQIADWLRLFIQPGQVTELRALQVLSGNYRRTVSGYFDFDHLESMATEALRLTRKASGIYFVFNPINPACLCRRTNRTDFAKDDELTKDEHILKRTAILIDADPKRPVSKVSASDDEKSLAWETIQAVNQHLDKEGFAGGVLADSGNGFHRYLWVDIPKDDADLVRAFLLYLANQFNSESVTIDTTVHNPARITKLPGTMARKGDHSDERPHRKSRVLEVLGDERHNADAIAKYITDRGYEFDGKIWRKKSTAPHAASIRNGVANNGSVRSRAIAYLAKMPPSIDGQGGHVALFNAAQVLVRGFSLSDDEAASILATEFNPRCVGPWDEEDISRKVSESREKSRMPDGYLLNEQQSKTNQTSTQSENKAQQPLRSYRRTDVGNAQRLADMYGDRIRHCHPWGKDLAWDGRRWRLDDRGQVVEWAKSTVKSIFREAAALEGDRRDELLKHASSSENRSRILTMIGLARSESGIPVVPDELDCNRWLFNVKNGTVNLQTGELKEHSRDDLITKLSPVVFDKNANCPRWLAFLNDIMDENDDLVSYLQRAVGYSLTGSVDEQCLFVCHGAGANGKSTFLETIMDIMGDYGSPAHSELLSVRKGESHPTEKAELFGKRFVSTIETEENRRMAESLLKQLTGGDRITARKMREDFWSFEPTHKLWLAANHKPIVRGTDYAIWRRIKLIPFTVTIPDSKKDSQLVAKLKRERDGIFQWALAGCLACQRDGIGEPDEVRMATAKYRSESDIVAKFLDECCETGEKLRVSSRDLNAAFKQWADDGRLPAMSRDKLGEKLGDKGFMNKRSGKNGSYEWHGLALITDDEDLFY